MYEIAPARIKNEMRMDRFIEVPNSLVSPDRDPAVPEMTQIIALLEVDVQADPVTRPPSHLERALIASAQGIGGTPASEGGCPGGAPTWATPSDGEGDRASCRAINPSMSSILGYSRGGSRSPPGTASSASFGGSPSPGTSSSKCQRR